MKRIKNADINLKLNPKRINLNNFSMRFYTVNSKAYFFIKDQDNVVSVEREATIYDDPEVIISGGTVAVDYYLPLDWSELVQLGEGVLNYRCINNIDDPFFPDLVYNQVVEDTTAYYIDSDIHIDPAEDDKNLIERVVELESNLAVETADREDADVFLSGAVDTEIARAISAETELSERIDAIESGASEALDDEIARAEAAEAALQDAIDAEEARAIAIENAIRQDLTDESEIRSSADTAMWTAINDEIVRSTSAETALDNKIDVENLRAIGVENAISGNLETYKATNNAALQAETTRAISAETALQTAINDEATARANADTALQTAITNEVSRAMEAESGITNSLNAEVTRATGAENALDDKIDAETTRATSAEAALDVKIGTVSGNVITEETRAKGVEDVLSGAIDTIDAKFIDDAKYEMSGQTHVINFYNGNTVKATIDCTDFLVDGMIDDVYIENGYLVIDFNTASGKQDIRIPLTDIFNPANYYTKSETSGATEIANALALKLNISDFNTYSGAVDTAINSKASQSTVDALNGVVTAHTADDSIHFTTGAVQTQIDNSISGKADSSDVYLKGETSGATEIATALSGKQATLVSSENIKTINNESILGSGNIDIQGGGGKAIEAGRGISVTTGETADTVSFNLPIYNGSGNNSIYLNSKRPQNYPNKASGENSFVVGTNNIASGSHSIAMGGYDSYGDGCSATTYNSFAMGRGTLSEGFCSIAKGYHNKSSNYYEESGGRFNVSNKANTTFGDSGNTLFSVGNGTADNARHNAFEIRQNGDIYISSGGTDIKLQDHLGGGGSITIDPSLDSGSTNAVANSAITTAIDAKANKGVFSEISITSMNNHPGAKFNKDDGSFSVLWLSRINGTKVFETGSLYTQAQDFSLVETSAITTSITSASTDVQVPSAKAVYDALGGLKLQQISQSDYDSLQTKDSSTLYIII